MELKTKRLILKAFAQEDFTRFYSVFSHPQVMRYALMDRVDDEAAAKQLFEEIVGGGTGAWEGGGFWAVYRTEDGAFIGTGDVELLYKRENGGCGDVGYFLLPEFWGGGYAAEIGEAICDYCFTTLGLHRVIARCNAENGGSERIMQKIGMTPEGRLRKERYKDGKWVDELRYSILLEEWEERRKSRQ